MALAIWFAQHDGKLNAMDGRKTRFFPFSKVRKGRNIFQAAQSRRKNSTTESKEELHDSNVNAICNM